MINQIEILTVLDDHNGLFKECLCRSNVNTEYEKGYVCPFTEYVLSTNDGVNFGIDNELASRNGVFSIIPIKDIAASTSEERFMKTKKLLYDTNS